MKEEEESIGYDSESDKAITPQALAEARLILGADSPAIAEGRVTSVQTISGTGANHLGALFLSRFYDFGEGGKKVYLSDPTWGKYQLPSSQLDFKIKATQFQVLCMLTRNITSHGSSLYRARFC